MARDESDDEEQDNTDLNISFKKLKVDPEWDKSATNQQPRCVDIHSIWSGESSNSANNEPPSKHAKLKVSPSRRAEPYPADCVLSFERLCLRKEKCNKKWCLCKYDKTASTSSDQKLNFAISGPRKLIHDARLKLHHHHAQRDQRQIIRAAKLQIKEAKKSKSQKSESKKESTSDINNSTPPKIFGAVSLENKNFTDVKSNPNKVSEPLPDKHYFNGYRASPSLTTSSASSSGRKGLKNDSCSSTDIVEKSCSQEATIDDLSVDELAGYFDDFVHIPKKMSVMAEMMYT